MTVRQCFLAFFLYFLHIFVVSSCSFEVFLDFKFIFTKLKTIPFQIMKMVLTTNKKYMKFLLPFSMVK